MGSRAGCTALVVAVAFMPACSAPASPPADAAIEDGTPVNPDGVFGRSVGSILENLLWEGFVDEQADAIATSKGYASYSPEALRHTARSLGLIHLSDVSSEGSARSADDLATRGPAAVQAGAALVGRAGAALRAGGGRRGGSAAHLGAYTSNARVGAHRGNPDEFE